ncbi:MAG: polysaccharide biosynthesis tyrosine autokinase [Desulfobacterales bacterium]
MTDRLDMQKEYPSEETIDLRDYMRIILKRRWTVIAFFAVVVFTVAVYTFSATPIFQATSRIVIEKENPNLVSIQEVMAVDATGTDYYQTQYKIIESRNVAREVIRRLDLENSPEFFPEPKKHFIADIKRSLSETVSQARGWIASLVRSDDAPSAKEKTGENAGEAALVSAFLSRVSVNPIRNSRLVDVSVEAKNPIMAAEMANALVSSYISRNLETKLEATKDAVKWLSERIAEERKKVEDAERALLQYKQTNEIITDFSSDAEKITAEKLASLNQQVVDAESLRVEAETRYLQALSLENTPNMIDSIPEVLSNDIIKEIKKMEVALYNRMSELSKKYGKNHPAMVAIESELADLRKRKAAEARQVINSLKNEYKLALAREESLKKALEGQKAETLEMNEKAIQFGVLQRQAESARNMYELLVKRFKETSLTEEMKTGNIRVIDKAEVPRGPIKPKKKLNILLAVVIGLAGGVGLAFFLEYLDNTIKFPDEIKQFLQIPYLGHIPAYLMSRSGGGPTPEKDLVVLDAPKSSVAESFRGIRTGIILSSPDTAPKVLMVTSAGPTEGKTFTAANLAVVMAGAGSRVLLMDCDMRRPRLHKVFDIQRNTGISGIISGGCDIKDAIVAGKVENLDILTSGPLPPNPAELLGSKKMAELMAAVKSDYDRVIIDTPPVSAVTDSVVLSAMADAVALVVRTNETPRQLVKNGVEQLKSVNANIIGAVLNGVNPGRDSYYYYQYYYYYYGDGPKRKRGEKKRKTQEQENHTSFPEA